MDLETSTTRASLIYQHLISVIVPRPIAWVSTRSSSGVTNLAPFSFFSGVGSRPPSLVFCPANRRDGTPKDTLRNILETGEFVVNVVPFSLSEQMVQTSAELVAEESEFQLTGLETVDSKIVRPPGVRLSPVRLECRLWKHLSLDDGPGGANLVIGHIALIHIQDDLLDGHGFVMEDRLDLIGRMGGSSYCRTTDRFEVLRPD